MLDKNDRAVVAYYIVTTRTDCGLLHDIWTHQSVAEELIESTSLHWDSWREADGPAAAHGYLLIRISRTETSEIQRAFRSSIASYCREMAGILAWFWNERFWLPHNVTWADLKNTDEATFPQAEDLYLACPLAFCIFMIRLVFERWVLSWRGEWSRWWWGCAFVVSMRRRTAVRCLFLSPPKQWHLIGLAHKSPRLIILLLQACSVVCLWCICQNRPGQT